LKDVIGIGMCAVDNLFLVPQLPTFGKRVIASEYSRQGGGPVATAMVALARLGADVSFVGKVGDDGDGDFIKSDFLRYGVDISHLITEKNAKSCVVLVLVDQNTGERCFTPRKETSSPLRVDELDREFITSASVLHLDSPDEASVTAAQWALETGMQVVYDGGWYDENTHKLLELTNVAIVSKFFAGRFSPNSSPEEITQELYAMGREVAIVTLGEKGCVVTYSEGTFRFPAFQIKVVDTTGAGDAFHGAFIYGMLQNWDVPKTVEFASAVAALNCRKLSGRAAIPDLEEALSFIESQRQNFLA